LTLAALDGRRAVALTPSRALTYKLPLSIGLAAVLSCVCLAVPAAASEKTVHGAIIPGGSREVGQDRYKSPEGFEDTLKFYSKAYSWEHYPRQHIADLPGVRAIHLGNPNRSGGWDGLNIYELNGETRIFVLARNQAAKSHRHR
jgi:hypothetical protein